MNEKISHFLKKTCFSKLANYLVIIFLFNTILFSGCIYKDSSEVDLPAVLHGMDTSLLQDMIGEIETNYSDIESVIISRYGSIVIEKYFNGWEASGEHNLYSCTKSVTSALIGIAIDEGYLNLDQYVLDFFPQKTFANVDLRKQTMTIEHLLEMKSGLEWDEWSTDYLNPANPVQLMMNSPDWVQFILDLPMNEEPGTHFTYNTGVSHLLTAIIQQVTNTSALLFAQEKLFKPLSIEVEEEDWYASPQGIVWDGAFLFLTPREMLNFGSLYLNNGIWDGEQIISKEWIEKSTRDYFYIGTRTAYSYQWWIYPDYYDYYTYTASGYLGQWITVIPDLDLVIIFTANSNESFHSILLKNYIISSIVDY